MFFGGEFIIFMLSFFIVLFIVFMWKYVSLHLLFCFVLNRGHINLTDRPQMFFSLNLAVLVYRLNIITIYM